MNSKRGLLFKSISGQKPKTNVFDLSHEKKVSANFADLVPIFLQEVIPGDKWKNTTEINLKTAPLVSPFLHRVNGHVHYFFVPNRLVWDNWQDFITGGVDGLASPTFPTLNYDDTGKGYFTVGSLADYFGIAVNDGTTTITVPKKVNALPFRAYQLIYNEYYRDQTLTPEVDIDKGDASNYWTAALTLRKRQWEKDYYTSCLPNAQRGADVMLPVDLEFKAGGATARKLDGTVAGNGAMSINSDLIRDLNSEPLNIDNYEGTSVTINDLRTSVRLQEWLEKNARAGGRYIEQILAHFGVRVPDHRLMRPELIGSGKFPIQISEVLANFEGTQTALGKQAGHAMAISANPSFQYSVLEHGYIIGILSITPRSGYMNQGIPKMFSKATKFDFAFPEFAHLGEEPILNKELFYDTGSDTLNEGVFGYTPRYSHYKYVPDTVHGEFNTYLEYWHLARKFANTPTLNNDFTECAVDNDRVFAVQDESTQKFWIQLYHNCRAIRPLPVFGTPML